MDVETRTISTALFAKRVGSRSPVLMLPVSRMRAIRRRSQGYRVDIIIVGRAQV
jgi:hypothetical protein